MHHPEAGPSGGPDNVAAGPGGDAGAAVSGSGGSQGCGAAGAGGSAGAGAGAGRDGVSDLGAPAGGLAGAGAGRDGRPVTEPPPDGGPELAPDGGPELAPDGGPELVPDGGPELAPGDFTTPPQVLWLVPVALCVGALGAAVSLALLAAIGLLTHAVYYQTFGIGLISPDHSTLGPLAIVIPVVGGLVVGLLARFGSEQVRGHGIPEAMENILVRGSRVQPRLAILKPISSAVSIGTGGPFGAEGPIILTGGAVGSIVGQLFRLTAVQRRTLLVAGAAAGMSAVFGTPVAATLFGVELLVFELRPRSMVLIGLSAAVADALRMAMASGGLVPAAPLFPIPSHPSLGAVALLGAVAIGISTGLGAWVMTWAVYGCEDLFGKLVGHLHWMWWPMIGGLMIGAGGLLEPRALGVGYDTIHAELLGRLGVGALLLLFAVKLVIWAAGLGSGTSGGILAPILMMGAAVGGVLGHALPGAPVGAFALIGMCGSLAGVTRSPFTAIVFAFELTHDQNSLLALLIAATVAHLISVLVLRRSILTEKVARRGLHVMREYSVDPLEATFVREVMDTDVLAVEPGRRLADLYRALPEGSPQRRQRLLPVLDADRALVGVLPLSAVIGDRGRGGSVRDAMVGPLAVAHPDEVLSAVADRMAQRGVGVVPVVDRTGAGRLEGLVSQDALLSARRRLLNEERRAERVLTPRLARRRPG